MPNHEKNVMVEPNHAAAPDERTTPPSHPAEVDDTGWDPYIVALTNAARSPDPHGADDGADWPVDDEDANATRRGQIMAWLREHRS
jgi:hypothetical protein